MIRFESVTHRYGKREALSGVDLHIAEGELVFLTGPSGSGKTTMLKLLTRELSASSGTVTVAGVDVGRVGATKIPVLRRTVAAIPQEYPLLPDRTVTDNIVFALTVQGWKRGAAHERVNEMLGLVGLTDHGGRRPHELSGGERQRVAIARAVAGGPLVLLADEPTGNLDPVSTHAIVAILATVADAGTTVIMSSHNPTVIDTFPNRVVRLAAGRIASDDHSKTSSPPAGPLTARDTVMS